MADVKWIKIVVDIFDDEKIRFIETLPNGDGIIVIWFKLVCLAGKSNCSGFLMMTDKIAYTDEILCSIFNRDIKLIQLALQTFERLDMIEITDNKIYLPNWEKHQSAEKLQKIKDDGRKRVEKHRLNAKCNEKSVTKALQDRYCNAIEEELEIDFKKHIVHFDNLWKLYPNKKGKGQVSDSQKKKLCKITFDEMQRALNRYLADLKKDDWRKLQNGSTFFNSGYVDYLDSNYVKQEIKAPTGYEGVERL